MVYFIKTHIATLNLFRIVSYRSTNDGMLIVVEFPYTPEDPVSYDKADKEATAQLKELKNTKPPLFKDDINCRAIVGLVYLASIQHGLAMKLIVEASSGNEKSVYSKKLFSGGGPEGFNATMFHFINEGLRAAGRSGQDIVARMNTFDYYEYPASKLKVALGDSIPNLADIRKTAVGKFCGTLTTSLLAVDSTSYQEVATIIGYSQHSEDNNGPDHFRLDDNKKTKIYFDTILDLDELKKKNITWVQEGYDVFLYNRRHIIARIKDYKPVGAIYNLAEAESEGVIVRGSTVFTVHSKIPDSSNFLPSNSKRKRNNLEFEDSESESESESESKSFTNDDHNSSPPLQSNNMLSITSSSTSSSTSNNYNNSNGRVSTKDNFVGRVDGRVFPGPELSMIPKYSYLLDQPLRGQPKNVLELLKYYGQDNDVFAHPLIKAEKVDEIDEEATYRNTGVIHFPLDATEFSYVLNRSSAPYANLPIGEKNSILTTKQTTKIDNVTTAKNVNRVEFTKAGVLGLCKENAEIRSLYCILQGKLRFIGYSTEGGTLTFTLPDGSTRTCKVAERGKFLSGLHKEGIGEIPVLETFSGAEWEVDEDEEVTAVGEGSSALIGEQLNMGDDAGPHTDGHQGVPSDLCRYIGGTSDKQHISTNLTNTKPNKYEDHHDVATLIAQPGTSERTFFVAASMANAFGDDNRLRNKGGKFRKM